MFQSRASLLELRRLTTRLAMSYSFIISLNCSPVNSGVGQTPEPEAQDESGWE
jgi:hypothetical protein